MDFPKVLPLALSMRLSSRNARAEDEVKIGPSHIPIPETEFQRFHFEVSGLW